MEVELSSAKLTAGIGWSVSLAYVFCFFVGSRLDGRDGEPVLLVALVAIGSVDLSFLDGHAAGVPRLCGQLKHFLPTPSIHQTPSLRVPPRPPPIHLHPSAKKILRLIPPHRPAAPDFVAEELLPLIATSTLDELVREQLPHSRWCCRRALDAHPRCALDR